MYSFFVVSAPLSILLGRLDAHVIGPPARHDTLLTDTGRYICLPGEMMPSTSPSTEAAPLWDDGSSQVPAYSNCALFVSAPVSRSITGACLNLIHCSHESAGMLNCPYPSERLRLPIKFATTDRTKCHAVHYFLWSDIPKLTNSLLEDILSLWNILYNDLLTSHNFTRVLRVTPISRETTTPAFEEDRCALPRITQSYGQDFLIHTTPC